MRKVLGLGWQARANASQEAAPAPLTSRPNALIGRTSGLRGRASALVVLGVAALVAFTVPNCGGGSGGGQSARNKQFVLNPPGTASNAGIMIMGVDKASIDANNADRITVTAQMLDPIGQPLAGEPVTFSATFSDVTFLDGTPAGTTGGPPTATTFTDGNGVASIIVRSGGTPGRLGIAASSRPNLALGGIIFFQLNDVGFISGELQVLPAEIDVTDPPAGTMLRFVIIGGQPFRSPDPPYRLQNESSGLGVAELIFDGTFPAEIKYTLSGRGEGAHVFSIVDGAGNSVTATVVVTLTDVEIIPNAASLVSGQMQEFAIRGGVGPYSCVPSGGTIDPTIIEQSGGTFTFTAGEVVTSTTFTIVCSDSAGQVASAEVTIGPAPSPGVSPGQTPVPQNITTIIVGANPASLNGIQGGTSNVTATALDQFNDPIAGVAVLFTLAAQTGTPTPTVPSITPLTAITDGNGQAVTVLTVPAGTAPQFIVINATASGVSGMAQVGVTSQSSGNPGPPARLTSALFRAGSFGDNGDGTFTTILSALVTDADGNPVADGIQVDWTSGSPGVNIFTPSFTNGQPPCNTASYTAGSGLVITPQPGTALTCLVYPAASAGNTVSITARVTGTTLMVTSAIPLPMPAASPTAPPAPTPVPPGPAIVPASASLMVGNSLTFVITGGAPPFTITANGGTAMPTVVNASGGSFTYTAGSAGSFAIIAVDAIGQAGTATVTNSP